MIQTTINVNGQEQEIPLEGLLLQCEKDRYKIGYTALRWAKEIKQKENLPDPIPLLIQRALREILTGKISIEEIEKLPMTVKITPAPIPTPNATISLNPSPPEEGEKKEEKS